MTTDHLADIRAQRDLINKRAAELETEKGKLGALVAAARSAGIGPDEIGGELAWSRETVRRTAAAHGYVHRWGSAEEGAEEVTPEEFRTRVETAVREWFGPASTKRTLQIRDLVHVARAAGRGESRLSKILGALTEGGDQALLVKGPASSGYRAGPALTAARATPGRPAKAAPAKRAAKAAPAKATTAPPAEAPATEAAKVPRKKLGPHARAKLKAARESGGGQATAEEVPGQIAHPAFSG